MGHHFPANAVSSLLRARGFPCLSSFLCQGLCTFCSCCLESSVPVLVCGWFLCVIQLKCHTRPQRKPTLTTPPHVAAPCGFPGFVFLSALTTLWHVLAVYALGSSGRGG